MEKKKKKIIYPTGSQYYSVCEEIGKGTSAQVHRAVCVPLKETVAIKMVDLERQSCDLEGVFRETQTMAMAEHPNLLQCHCSFVCGHHLWLVMPYMAGGSCLHILKSAHPNGLPELAIATILRDILKALHYLHRHGHIHRDLKAGNILLASDGSVKLADFGVSASLFQSGDRQRLRNTFVGTPCWMAPEVMDQRGYDFRADIWSFGITALELAHGNAPFARFPPIKVLLMTLQTTPPGLENRQGVEFTTSFKHMVGACLLKDASKRPTASKLLKHSFFKQARSNDYISRTLLQGLPPLGDRVLDLNHNLPAPPIEDMSQTEYKRGISSWSFDLDMFRAAMNQNIEEPIEDPVSDNSQPESSYSPPSLEENNCVLPFVDSALDDDEDKLQGQIATSLNSVDGVGLDVSSRQSKSPDGDEVDDKTKEPVVQQRGRFKVTSENVDREKVVSTPTLEKSSSMPAIARSSSQVVVSSRPQSPPNAVALSKDYSLFSFLNTVLESNIVQRDIILNIMKHAAGGGFTGDDVCTSSDSTERTLLEEAHHREKELLGEIIDLKERTLSLLRDEEQEKITPEDEA